MHIPLPQPVVGAFGGKFELLRAASERPLHACVLERANLDIVAMSSGVFGGFDICAVCAVDEVQRNGDNRQDVPCMAIYQFDDRDGDGGSDHVSRTAAERALRPRTLGR